MVHGYADTAPFRVVGNPLGFEQAAGSLDVGMDRVQGAVVEQRLKTALKPENILAGQDGRDGGVGDGLVSLPIEVGILSTFRYLEEVFGPGKLVRFEGPGVADRIVDIERAEVVGGQGRARTDDIADGGDVFAQVTQALFGADAALVERAGTVAQHAGLQVHLEESQPHFLALPHALSVNLGVFMRSCVRIDTDAIAILIANQPVGGNAIDLAGNVVEGHIDRAVTPAHAAVVGELAQHSQVALYVQGVSAH